MIITLTISFESTWDHPHTPFVLPKKKKCLVCQKRKHRSEFGKQPRQYDGVNLYCKDCS